ncbi:MAG: phosphodiesterase [Actinomycetota bacterium]|nr:phosphodiesterase [Actinomycetota bacterium]MEE2958386.1 phosphodiesterase [Actinomycetota bacterium]
MLLAQVTDCHIRDRDTPVGRLVDTTETLGRVVEHLLGLDPAPDVVLATGDLTDDGTPDQYATLRDVLAPIADRLVPVPGNHDEAMAFRLAFTDLLPGDLPDDHCSYVVEDHPVRLVGLDTTLPGRNDGRFDADREGWLEEVLAAEPDRPTAVFTHFPPFETGLRFMDQAGLIDADRLRATIERHPQVRLLACGHLHRPIQTSIGAAVATTCPSTGNQLGLHLDSDRAGAVNEPPAYQLHRWDGERFTTHTGVVRDPDAVKTVDLSEYAAEVRRRHASGEPFSKA